MLSRILVDPTPTFWGSGSGFAELRPMRPVARRILGPGHRVAAAGFPRHVVDEDAIGTLEASLESKGFPSIWAVSLFLKKHFRVTLKLPHPYKEA